MTEPLKQGDRVKWQTSGGETEGVVEQKLTEPTDIKKHHIAASPEHPEYLAKSDKSGKPAAHKPEALEKLEE